MPTEPFSTQSRSRTCKHLILSQAARRWRIWALRSSSPGWTRTTDHLLVRKLPSPLGHRTVCCVERKSRDSNPQVARATNCFQDSLLIQPDDFRKAAGVGIEPTSERSERPVLPLNDPAVVFVLLVPGVGIEPTDSCFKGRQHYQQRRPRNV